MTIVQHPEAYESATKARIIANARKTFLSTYPDGLTIVAWCNQNGRDGSDYKETFAGSMAKNLAVYGKLTVKQVEAIRNTMATAAARRQEWADKRAAENAKKEWVGEIGKRVELILTVRHIVPLHGYYGMTWIYICNDQFGNDVIYKGTSQFLEKDETGVVLATVKGHGVRDGVKQTTIQRPKLK